jgi:NAD(P)H-nitrite reductase large subunit
LAIAPEAIALRSAKWYEEIGVDLHLGAVVTSLDAATKTITLADGSSLNYDDAIIATGSRPFNIPVPGHDLENVFTLRGPDDAAKIEALGSNVDANVVLIGTGFIGLETATYLKNVKKVKNVTCVSLDKSPLERVLGTKVGDIFKKIHEEAGVKLMLNVHLSGYEGKDGKVTGVIIQEQKEAIPADCKCTSLNDFLTYFI